MNHFTGSIAMGGVLGVDSGVPVAAGDIIVLFRGYISNRSDCVSEDSVADRPYTEPSDAHRILTAYRRWGAKLSYYVFGEYCVALYDKSARVLILTNDNFGVIPLYYRSTGDGIVFSSEIRGCTDLASPHLDEEYISDYLHYGDHYGRRTPFAEISRLEVGKALVYDYLGLRTIDCWRVNGSKGPRHTNMRDYEEQLRSLVTTAVEAAALGAREIWCELSGGLDSSTVLSVAAESLGLDNVSAISFTYSASRSADEGQWIRSVLNKCPVKWYPLDVDSAQPFKQLPPISGQPYHAMINTAQYRLYESMLDQRSVEVVLTGMGGDAVLLGDGPQPYFFADLLLSGQIIRLLRLVGHWATSSPNRRPPRFWLDRCAITPIIRHVRGALIENSPVVVPWISEQFRKRFPRSQDERKSWAPKCQGIGISWFMERVLRCSNVISRWDHMSHMSASFRHPLLYLPLVELVASIPWETQMDPRRDRVLHRASLARTLPRIVAERTTKAGPDEAVYDGLANSPHWLKILLEKPRMVDLGFVDAAAWDDAVKLAIVGRCVSIKHFVAAATLEAWLRQIAP